MKQNPFGIYDFLGYLVPGLFFLVGLHFSVIYSDSIFYKDIYQSLISNIKFNSLEITLTTIVCYIVGHSISLLSSELIEKYYTTTYDYPSFFLFKDVEKNNIFIHLRKVYVSLLIEDKLDTNNRTYKEYNVRKLIGYIINQIVVFPLLILEKVFLCAFNTLPRKLPKELSIPILKKLNSILREEQIIKGNQNKESLEGDTFRFLYHYTLERTTNHYNTIKNYVALYGFNRSISFGIILLWWINLLLSDNNFGFIFSWFSLLIAAFSYVFYLGFTKFYRRYTLETIMGAVTINDKNKT